MSREETSSVEEREREEGETGSHYEVLGLPLNASDSEVKQAFHRLARRHHPDKQLSALPSSSSSAIDNSYFMAIQEAWKVLGDREKRLLYDKEIRDSIQAYQTAWNAAEEVRQEDFHFTAEEGTEGWILYCRCGDYFQFTAEDLDSPRLLIPCNGCSLHVRMIVTSSSSDNETLR
eukprot:gene6119-6737_t